MHAVLTAGGKPESDDPLYPETNGGYKALIEINGRSMVQRVIDALDESESIDRIVLVGLPVFTDLQCRKTLTMLPDAGSMLENLRTGVDELLSQDPAIVHFLAVSSDIPALTPPMVDWMVRTMAETDDDLYYPVIERSDMERRFPTSHRTYLHLKSAELCGGDVIGLRAAIVNPNNPLFQRMVAARKSPMRQASLLGIDTLLLLLLRRLDIAQAAELIGKRLSVSGRALPCPYPEMGMDVDKPHQLELMRADLAGQRVA